MITTGTSAPPPGEEPVTLPERPFPRLVAAGAAHNSASVIGLGCWQLGADWGSIDEETAIEVLEAAVESGVTFFDTADTYGDGRSERTIAHFLDRFDRRDDVMVATKIGRRANPFDVSSYTPTNIRAWVDRSRRNLETETLHLVQLHCPPPAVYQADQVFDTLDQLCDEHAIAGYGVSVETCEEALSAIARPGVVSIQIILNAFRLKPLEQVLPAAEAAGVGIITRVPLASGLLSGKYTRTTSFAADDHRNYNRHGESFNVGETFSGVDYETGLAAVEELRAALPPDVPLPAAALRWIVDQPGVTTVIPGARHPAQARANAAAGRTPLPAGFADTVRDVYDRRLRASIHPHW